MNERNIEDIIGALYDLVQDARSVPLAALLSVTAFLICWMRSLPSCPVS